MTRRAIEEYRTTWHSKVYDRLRRIFELSCSYCHPHQNENRRTWRKHGVQKKRKRWSR